MCYLFINAQKSNTTVVVTTTTTTVKPVVVVTTTTTVKPVVVVATTPAVKPAEVVATTVVVKPVEVVETSTIMKVSHAGKTTGGPTTTELMDTDDTTVPVIAYTGLTPGFGHRPHAHRYIGPYVEPPPHPLGYCIRGRLSCSRILPCCNGRCNVTRMHCPENQNVQS
ncbi:unnamed protein product [Adineta steineri]|uniref:Uncharacterized protein n=1 Tax=Adineta steineri TaxID=433720 RepID=A0A818QSH2_9BILA|nr:unnamed protein product [Adineta steineri]CAF1008004.1 unnamed protein product [Adineta steineri]CAF3587565.1 unnamed protein product [Adineta steineri]CAF3646008.1 unnamed protein product [Adineta steineri]